MKRLTFFAALLISVLFVACSKDKGGGGGQVATTTPYQNGAGVPGPYAPGYNNCGNGQIPTVPYQNYYYGQPLNQTNCIGAHHFQGHNPYFIRYSIGYNLVNFAGTCDFRLSGQLCPPGYRCQPIGLGSQGVCSGGYYY